MKSSYFGAAILLRATIVPIHAQVVTLGSFNGTNGSYPVNNLLVSDGMIYGVTQGGGANNFGEIYSLPVTGGTPAMLASFPFGQSTAGGLAISGNTLYGTLSDGGVSGDGTVFSVPDGRCAYNLGYFQRTERNGAALEFDGRKWCPLRNGNYRWS